MLLEVATHYLLPILFLTGLVAGLVDAIAGGGGLISLPVLLGVGVPPHIALGTNKLQASVGTFVATHSYYRQGWISFRTAFIGLLFGLLGASLGAIAGQIISTNILEKIIPILLLVILIYSIFSPRIGALDHKTRMSEMWFFPIFGFLLGFYDGFFGPGAGSLWVFSIVFFLGYSLTKATAYTKIFNLNSNVVAMVCFAIGGNIDYRVAGFMAAGQLIGGKLGAHLAIKKGVGLIRPIFLTVVGVTIVLLIVRAR